jgi:hypothetical protein
VLLFDFCFLFLHHAFRQPAKSRHPAAPPYSSQLMRSSNVWRLITSLAFPSEIMTIAGLVTRL